MVENELLNDKIQVLANLERIRSARIEPLLLRINKKAGLSTSSEVIVLPKMTPKRIHVITNICCVCIGSGTPQVFIGIRHGGEKYYLYSFTVAAAENSITWSGQAILQEFDEIFAELQSATAADEVVLTANGYSMRL